jgi:hypothetical protein
MELRVSTKCINRDEIIKHLFFQCNFARSIWSVIQVVSNWSSPHNVNNIFGNCLHGIDHKYKILLRVAVIAIVWSV